MSLSRVLVGTRVCGAMDEDCLERADKQQPVKAAETVSVAVNASKVFRVVMIHA
jgi:hypothetical protein